MGFLEAKKKYLHKFVGRKSSFYQVENVRKTESHIWIDFKGYVPANQKRSVDVEEIEKEWKIIG